MITTEAMTGSNNERGFLNFSFSFTRWVNLTKNIQPTKLRVHCELGRKNLGIYREGKRGDIHSISAGNDWVHGII